MNLPLSEAKIVKALAEAVTQRCIQTAIKDLDNLNDTCSGEGSQLETIWEEICVQVQWEQPLIWEVYEETVKAEIGGLVAELPSHEKQAVWLQTEAGTDWKLEDPDERDSDPVNDDHVEAYLINLVYDEAERWSNERIRAFIERSRTRD